MSNPNIKLAKFAGFCYGVKRAVETAVKLKAENPEKNIYILGELIHNMDVIRELDDLGINTIYEVPEQGSGVCIVRSHGEAPEVFEKIKNAGFEVVDLTCPDVKKVQQRAIELAQNDYFVVIVGKPNHPEVIAIRANAEQYSDKVVVATTIEELEPYQAEIKSHRKVGVVVQTTQMVSSLNLVVNYLNTIALASKKSANTTHLAEILKDCTKTIHIENDEELNKDLLIGVDSIGITAGASTPQKIIDKVINVIKKEDK